MDDIYNSKILEYAGTIQRIGKLGDAHATAEKHSRLCGSRLTVFLKAEQGRVTDFSHEIRACALGQASASIMATAIVGADFGEIRQARDDMHAMLKQGGAGPTGRFAEMRCLQPVKDFKARHASTLLTFEAVVDCLDQIEAHDQALAG